MCKSKNRAGDEFSPTTLANCYHSTMFENWAKTIAASLQAESELAGRLIEHSGRRGSEREGIVRAALARILPSDVEIGTGQVFDFVGGISRQVDVVVARKNFPVVRFNDGSCNYVIESVIATIEVKSHLDASTLRAGIENCMSVSKLQQSLRLSCLSDLARIHNVSFDDNNQPTGDTAKVRKFLLSSKPATYVLGYQGQADIWQPFSKWYQEAAEKKVWDVPSMIISLRNSTRAPRDEFNFIVRNDDACLVEQRCPHAFAGRHENPLELFIGHMLKTIFRSCAAPPTPEGFAYSALPYIRNATFGATQGIGELLGS